MSRGLKLAMAAGAVLGAWVALTWPSEPCKRFEMREVEMPIERSHGPSHMQQFQYKVCVER